MLLNNYIIIVYELYDVFMSVSTIIDLSYTNFKLKQIHVEIHFIFDS